MSGLVKKQPRQPAQPTSLGAGGRLLSTCSKLSTSLDVSNIAHICPNLRAGQISGSFRRLPGIQWLRSEQSTSPHRSLQSGLLHLHKIPKSQSLRGLRPIPEFSIIEDVGARTDTQRLTLAELHFTISPYISQGLIDDESAVVLADSYPQTVAGGSIRDAPGARLPHPNTANLPTSSQPQRVGWVKSPGRNAAERRGEPFSRFSKIAILKTCTLAAGGEGQILTTKRLPNDGGSQIFAPSKFYF